MKNIDNMYGIWGIDVATFIQKLALIFNDGGDK